MTAYLMALCMIGCTYEGYDSGKYEKKRCECISYYEPSDFKIKRVKKEKPKKEE